jgi:GTP-binding protein EngB required for normal cell division
MTLLPETDIIFKRMQSIKVYNVLIIGRSGAGKSATTKLLTSNPAIRVANSLKEVTTEVNFYDGSAFEVAGE